VGIVYSGIPREFALDLSRQFDVKTFVETGTHVGDTAAWAAQNFNSVTSIELFKSLYEQACNRHGYLANINFIYGDSRKALVDIVEKLDAPALFWLDSHWSCGATYGEGDECPLLEEIDAINRSKIEHFVFVDDARFFLSPPTKPHNIEQWPSIDMVIQALKSDGKSNYIVIFNDVIISVPEYAKAFVAEYCQDANTRTHVAWMSERKKSYFQRALRLLVDSGKVMMQGILNWFTASSNKVSF